jgi:hypothetical protein
MPRTCELMETKAMVFPKMHLTALRGSGEMSRITKKISSVLVINSI